jgi:hypothetical protein
VGAGRVRARKRFFCSVGKNREEKVRSLSLYLQLNKTKSECQGASVVTLKEFLRILSFGLSRQERIHGPGNTMTRASLYVIFMHTPAALIEPAAAATGLLQALLRQQSVALLLQLLHHTGVCVCVQVCTSVYALYT